MFQTLHLWSQILEISSLFYKIAQFLLCYKIQKALSLIFFFNLPAVSGIIYSLRSDQVCNDGK